MTDRDPQGSASPPPSEGHQGVDPKLLEILVCPLTKAPLRYDRARQELVSDKARLAYPIRDGIPIMLVDEARPLADDEGVKVP
jgi:uncharacterized protein YbaR (Trm112 family)